MTILSKVEEQSNTHHCSLRVWYDSHCATRKLLSTPVISAALIPNTPASTCTVSPMPTTTSRLLVLAFLMASSSSPPTFYVPVDSALVLKTCKDENLRMLVTEGNAACCSLLPCLYMMLPKPKIQTSSGSFCKVSFIDSRGTGCTPKIKLHTC